MSPTASGLRISESTQTNMQVPWVEIEKGIRKVCFMSDIFSDKNFGPNVHVNLFSNNKVVMY